MEIGAFGDTAINFSEAVANDYYLRSVVREFVSDSAASSGAPSSFKDAAPSSGEVCVLVELTVCGMSRQVTLHN